MKVGIIVPYIYSIIPVIRILTFEQYWLFGIKNLGKIQNHKFSKFAPQINFLLYSMLDHRAIGASPLKGWANPRCYYNIVLLLPVFVVHSEHLHRSRMPGILLTSTYIARNVCTARCRAFPRIPPSALLGMAYSSETSKLTRFSG